MYMVDGISLLNATVVKVFHDSDEIFGQRVLFGGQELTNTQRANVCIMYRIPKLSEKSPPVVMAILYRCTFYPPYLSPNNYLVEKYVKTFKCLCAKLDPLYILSIIVCTSCSIIE